MASTKYTGIVVGALKYRRCSRVEIVNDLFCPPSITFHEDDVTRLDDSTCIKTPSGSVGETMTEQNMGTSFPLIHPDTMEPLGASATYTDVSVMLRSLYAHLANARDMQV
jgi:hypothetical protein